MNRCKHAFNGKAALAALLLLFCLVSGASCDAVSKNQNAGQAAYAPVLTVTGDVASEVVLSSLNSYALHTVQQDDRSYSGVLLSDVFSKAAPQGSGITAYFSAPDGVMASMPIEQAKDCYLTFADTGWTLVAPNHPPQARMKQMNRIVLCADGIDEGQKCFRIIRGSQTTTYSFGQLFLQDTVSALTLEGQPQKAVGGVTYDANAYTRRNLIPLSSMVSKDKGTALCYLGSGAQVQIDLNGYLEWRGNSVDYVGVNRRDRQKDVVGIWIDAPKASVTDVPALALDALKTGKVMVIEIDGLGYEAYQQFVQSCPTLKAFHAQAARTVMPSISNVALAGILCAQTPDKTGVVKRDDRELAVKDMFTAAKEMNKSCAMIEGQSSLVNLNMEQTLNADQNGNGTDDEVQKSALAAVSSGTDMIYVHFHGVDDIGHADGPLSAQAFAKAKELDGYIAALKQKFFGSIILISDHGMHETNAAQESGEHGAFMPSDMIVPLGILK